MSKSPGIPLISSGCYVAERDLLIPLLLVLKCAKKQSCGCIFLEGLERCLTQGPRDYPEGRVVSRVIQAIYSRSQIGAQAWLSDATETRIFVSDGKVEATVATGPFDDGGTEPSVIKLSVLFDLDVLSLVHEASVSLASTVRMPVSLFAEAVMQTRLLVSAEALIEIDETVTTSLNDDASH